MASAGGPTSEGLVDEELELAEGDAELRTKPIDRNVHALILPHYLAFQAVKAVIATHCLFVTYCFRCTQELATVRTIHAHPLAWRHRLAQYRAATAVGAQSSAKQRPDAAPAMRVGMIGCGVVGRTIADSLLDSGLMPPSDLAVSTRTVARANDLAIQGVHVAFDNAAVAADASILFICVLPPQLPAIASELRAVLKPHTLVVVAAAALPTPKLHALFPRNRALHASSVDAPRVRAELGIDGAVRAYERERLQRRGAAVAGPLRLFAERSAVGAAAGAEEGAGAQAAGWAHGRPSAMHPSSFLHGAEHIIRLAASHASDRWACALAYALEVAQHGLDLEPDERKLVCLKAVLGPELRGEHVMQDIDLLDAQRPAVQGPLALTPAQIARREQAEAARAAAAGVLAAGARRNLSSVVMRLHAREGLAAAAALAAATGTAEEAAEQRAESRATSPTMDGGSDGGLALGGP